MTRKPLLPLVFIFISLFFSSPFSYGDEIFTFVVKKQEEKKSRGWNLAEWLETRDRMRLMDLWLALHSPTPYEFYLGADYQFFQAPPGPQEHAWRTYFGAYASIFGLEAQWESNSLHRLYGIFHLRIFGYHAQGTNITLQAGLRSQGQGTSFRNGFVGVSMTVYLARLFGVEGLYRHYFSSTPNAQGLELAGQRYEGGAFIDFRFLRIYGTYFSEPEELTLGGVSSHQRRSGTEFGTRIFF